jgi:hypothetical protein
LNIAIALSKKPKLNFPPTLNSQSDHGHICFRIRKQIRLISQQIQQTNTLRCSAIYYLQLLYFKNNLILPQSWWKHDKTETCYNWNFGSATIFRPNLRNCKPNVKNLVQLERICKYLQLYYLSQSEIMHNLVPVLWLSTLVMNPDHISVL